MDKKEQIQGLLVDTLVGCAENLQQEEKKNMQWRGSYKEPRNRAFWPKEDQSSGPLQKTAQCGSGMLDKRKYLCKSQNRNAAGHTGLRVMSLEALGCCYRGGRRGWTLGAAHPGQLCFHALVGTHLKIGFALTVLPKFKKPPDYAIFKFFFPSKISEILSLKIHLKTYIRLFS